MRLFIAASFIFLLTLGVPAAPDSTHVSGPAVPDSTHRNLKRADTVLVVKHEFRHREQIVTGGVIMACLVSMLVVMNNYNPR